MNEFEQDFNEEMDPVQKAELEKIYQEEIEKSMRAAFEFIDENMGWEQWITNRSIGTVERKRRILTNMMNWFANPEVEEYEKSAKIKKVLEKL